MEDLIEKKDGELLQKHACDSSDYLIAVACGAVSGLVDIFLVGAPSQSVIGKWTDAQVDEAVKKFAEKSGWSPRPGKEGNAEALNTTPEYLLGNSGMLVLAAQEQGGAKAAREIDELVSEVSGMFAGGSLSEDALDGAMQALTRAYWIAKEKNKKYTPKKYRKEQTEE